MRPLPSPYVIARSTLHSKPLLVADLLLFLLFLAIPNLLVGSNFVSRHQAQTIGISTDWVQTMAILAEGIGRPNLMLWVLLNGALCMMVLALRRYVLFPIIATAYQIQRMLGALHPEVTPHFTAMNIRAIAFDMARIASIAHDYYLRNHDTKVALHEAQRATQEITDHYTKIMDCASREMITQYQSVLSYANYLEDQIAKYSFAQDMRYDFDDISESGFNLKLMAGALSLIHEQRKPNLMSFNVAQLMQETMIALATSLERRCMKLSSIDVDTKITAWSDPVIITHIIWMILLGTIRYAADESVLHLRCHDNESKTQAILGITISELSPGNLSEQERGAFLERQLEQFSPHMFAETIRIHANVQLIEMLLKPLKGQLTIEEINSHSCEICLTIPSTEKDT